MSLNVVSNFAASVAHRNLLTTNQRATDSLAKLSSGTRVVSAKDDAASLAIGKGLEAAVASLKTAQVNAGQAQSMLQIADGALSNISDILVRMRTLSVQSASGQYGTTERTYMNNEFGALRSEIDRIAQNTEFNGNHILNGSNTFVAGTVGTGIDPSSGVEQYIFGGNPGGAYLSATDTITVGYVAATNTMTLTNQVTGSTESTTVSSTAPAVGTFQNVTFGNFSVTVQLNSQFDPAADIAANNEFIVGGGASNTYSTTFQIGKGTTASDQISVAVGSARVAALNAGLATDDISTSGGAQTAITNIDAAAVQVNTVRADLGTAQNRMGFASANLATTVENSEAARSNLLDLDVASEMSTFTSQQVLQQAGVAMLAQANQMPQSLLRLLQG
jgi:flagellin